MRKYFVSYTYSTPNSFGFGSIELDLDEPVTSGEDVDLMKEWIEENCCGKDLPVDTRVVILNWRRFEDPE